MKCEERWVIDRVLVGGVIVLEGNRKVSLKDIGKEELVGCRIEVIKKLR